MHLYMYVMVKSKYFSVVILKKKMEKMIEKTFGAKIRFVRNREEI